MNLQGKPVTLHDMCLRDGMHPMRHQISIEQMVDIATGLGEPALTAAKAAGPTGHVLATDLSQDMMDFAATRAKDLGLSNVDFYDASDNITTQFMAFDDNKWYKFRIRVSDRLAWERCANCSASSSKYRPTAS